MSFKLRYNLFFAVTQQAVYKAYEAFWAERGSRVVPVKIRPLPERDFDTYDLHRSDGCWTLLHWCGGWVEWDLKRQAQLHVSRVLGCPGLLVFEFNGSYWGYELFNAGQAIDHFVQRPSEASTWFPGRDCRGNPELFATQFRPWLNLNVVNLAAYLAPVSDRRQGRWQDPLKYYSEYERLNVPAHGRDENRRFDPFSSVDFLHFLGLRVEWRNYRRRYKHWRHYDGPYLTPLAPVWRAFKVIDPTAS